MFARHKEKIPMALHLQFRPHAGGREPLTRSEMTSLVKLEAETVLSKILIFIGWKINTRTLEIKLPFDK